MYSSFSGKNYLDDKCIDDENIGCQKMSLEDFINAYFQHEPVYCIKYNEPELPNTE